MMCKILLLSIIANVLVAGVQAKDAVHILPRQAAPGFTVNAVLPDGKFGKVSLADYSGLYWHHIVKESTSCCSFILSILRTFAPLNSMPFLTQCRSLRLSMLSCLVSVPIVTSLTWPGVRLHATKVVWGHYKFLYWPISGRTLPNRTACW